LSITGGIKSCLKKKWTYAKFLTSPQRFINKEVILRNRTRFGYETFWVSARN